MNNFEKKLKKSFFATKHLFCLTSIIVTAHFSSDSLFYGFPENIFN